MVKLLLLKIQRVCVRNRLLFLVFPLILPCVVLLLPAPETAPNIVHFLGRFHPLVVHFPIVLVVLAFLLELAKYFALWHVSEKTLAFVLALALASTYLSLILGLTLYYTGEYTGSAMTQHLWGAILLMLFLSSAFFFFLTHSTNASKRSYGLYLLFLFASNMILGYTSHQGGSLTHGSEYLTEYMPNFTNAQAEPDKPLNELVVFEDLIMPVLDRKCISCHNENKSKGDLIMTSRQSLLKAGKSGLPAVVPGSAISSDVLRRVTLPESHDDRMPPEGKVGMTEHEVRLLEWWINNGAPADLNVAHAMSDSAIEPLLKRVSADIEAQRRRARLQQLNIEKLIKTVSRKNYVIDIDPEDADAIRLSMTFPPEGFGDDDLLNIEPAFSKISSASFIGSDLSDDALYHVGKMHALRELYLQQTRIDGSGLIHLSALHNLTLLDLSQSGISNGHLLNVINLRSLKHLYLYECDISSEVLDAIKQNRPDLIVHMERGKLF